MLHLKLSRAHALVIGLSVALSSTAAAAPTAAKPAYRLASTWKLVGDRFWDYLTLDSQAHRLYIPRDTQIQVLDTRTGTLVGHLDGLKGAHGIVLLPRRGRGFVTSGDQNRVLCFDLHTLRPVGVPIRVGLNPDAIALEPTTGRLFVMNHSGRSVSVIDPASRKVVKTLALGGTLESAAVDGKGSVFVNIESASQIAQINARTLRVVHVWSLAPGKEPTGLAYNPKEGHLFVACSNRTLIVLNARTGAVKAHLPIGAGVDAAVFDAKSDLAFTSNGESGTVSIIGQDAKGQPVIVATLPTYKNARTMTLDPQTGTLFLVGAEYQPLKPRQQYPDMVPGTAIVLKYELAANKKEQEKLAWSSR